MLAALATMRRTVRTLETFQPYHLKLLEERGVHPAQLAQVSPRDGMAFAPELALLGPAYTAFADDQVLAVGGILIAGSPFGVLWVLASEEVPRHALYLHRVLERLISSTISAYRLRRIEATVDMGTPARPKLCPPACRWLRLLGFVSEGESRNYGQHGETHLRWARVGYVPGAS